MAESFDPFIGRVTIEDLRGLSPAGAEEEGAREFCLGVPALLGWEEPCFFLCFFRVDSLPLVSEADMCGDAARFRWLCFFRESVFGRPSGVLLPFEEEPDAAGLLAISLFFSFSFASSSLRRSSSACFSSSLVSLSLCNHVRDGNTQTSRFLLTSAAYGSESESLAKE